MQKTETIIFLLFFSILIFGNLQTIYAENINNISNYSVKLSISPSLIEDGSNIHPIGYVYIVNSKGTPITSDDDINIKLSSEDPQIASVPNEITLQANSEFAKFNIVSGINGDTVITATLNDKIDFKHIQVGTSNTLLPDDLVLELNLPSDQMHVYSDMPFSVYLKTSDGHVVRAPYDINVDLEYEKSLAFPNLDKLVIKTGEYYGWGTITTNEKVGNTFLRAIQKETQLDTAKSITISSTLPSSLSLMIYPELTNAEVDRKVSIFVSLLDSTGNPAIATQDIPLKFYSNDQNFIGNGLDKAMKTMKPVIKKGEFGYLFEPSFNLIGFLANDVHIGVSAEGYGIAEDTFSTVGKSINTSDTRLVTSTKVSKDQNLDPMDNKMVQIFGPSKIPSNSTAVFAYQMAVVETDDDDPKDLEDKLADMDKSKILLYDIDYLENGELYPLQSTEEYRANGEVQLLGVVSSDNSLVKIKDPGIIERSNSYGTTTVSSGQNSGEVLLSVNLKGIGSNSFSTEVVNSREQKEIRVFSPTGNDSILFNRDGSFDIFLVAIDGQNRPKILDSDLKYLITPTNGIVDIKKGTSFAFASLQSDSFSLVDGDSVDLTVSPIGEGANLSMESFKTFKTQLSSQILVKFPISNPNLKYDNHVAIVQITDLQGNPILSSKDIKVKIISSDAKIIPQDATITKGFSYAEFPFKTIGSLEKTTISANAKGLVGSNSTLSPTSSSTELRISTSGLVEPFPVNKPIPIKLFVDDENNDSVEGAEIMIKSDGNSTASNNIVRTDKDGSATVNLTALSGPQISVDLFATAEGYVDGEKTLVIQTDSIPGNGLAVNSELPLLIVITIIGVSIVMGVLVLIKRRKSKPTIEMNEWEDDDI